MELTIHDSNMNKVAWIDNNKQGTLNFTKDLLTEDITGLSSVFEFEVYKKELLTDLPERKVYEYLNDRAFISFAKGEKTYLFNVIEFIETEKTIHCYCESLPMDLLNEVSQPYESKKMLSFVEYSNAMELLANSAITIGLNELKTKKLQLSFSSEETKLARLLNLAKEFGAELEVDTQLTANSHIVHNKLNIYHGHDETHHGLGNVRKDLVLRYGKNLKSITRKVSKKNLYTAIIPVGKRSDVTKTRTSTVNNPDGTTTTTEKVSNGDKGYTVTTTIKDKSGKVLSTKKVVATKQSDGSIKKSTTNNVASKITTSTTSTAVIKNKDGSKTSTTTVSYSDGRVEKTIVHTVTQKLADKTVITTVRTTKPDGSITEQKTTKYPNGSSRKDTKLIKAGSSTKYTTVSKVDETSDAEFDLSKSPDWKKKNSDGVVEFYKKGNAIYAPVASNLYPAVYAPNSHNNQWIFIEKEFEADSEEELAALALEYLESTCYPKITYDVNGFVDAEIGDTIAIEDDGFSNLFLATARVIKKETSQTENGRNKVTVSNVKTLKNLLPQSLSNRVFELANEAIPYSLKLETDNGVVFKNKEGQSTVIAKVYKGAFEANENVVISWSLNGVEVIADNYTVRASDVENTALLKVTAIINNEEVASQELTFTSVLDGEKGTFDGSIGGVNLLANSSFLYSKVADSFSVDGVTYNKTFIPEWNPLVNKGIGNWEEIYHAYVGNFGNRDDVVAFDESNGRRNQKSLNQIVSYNVPQTTNDFTFSADVFASGSGTKLFGGFWYFKKGGDRAFHAGQLNLEIGLVGQWHRVNAKVPFNKDECDFSKELRFFIYGYNFTSNSILAIDKVKLEEGTVATAYSISPKDTQKAIDEKADNHLVNERLNDIDESQRILEKEIQKRLTEQALLDWAEEYNKTVTASTNEARKRAEEALKKSSERLIEITKLGEKAQKWETTTGYIQAGDDGVTIAKKGSDTQFIVTNDVISFVSGGKAVMTLTKGELNVDNGVFALSVRIGRFVESPLESNPDINVIRYIGEAR